MDKIELGWGFTEDEYSAIMAMANEIGATHLYAFSDRKNWFTENGEPYNTIYEKLDDGQWFHYDELKFAEGEFEWIPADDAFNSSDVIPLHYFYKYIDQGVTVTPAEVELKDAIFTVLKAGYTIVPPQTKE